MKKIILAACCAALAFGLTGCVSTSGAENNPTTAPTTMAPAPTAMATMPPMITEPMTPTLEPNAPGGLMTEETVAPGTNGVNGVNGTNGAVGNGMANTEDSGRMAERISDEVERLSEIDDAETVIRGDTAVVAVQFDDQYKGGMTTRIQDMVTTRVQNVDKNIKKVHVTNDQELYTTIDDWAERLEKGTIKTMDEIGNDFEALVKRIVPVA